VLEGVRQAVQAQQNTLEGVAILEALMEAEAEVVRLAQMEQAVTVGKPILMQAEAEAETEAANPQ
jgi:hypothetical protein